jgi:hypothetical protein
MSGRMNWGRKRGLTQEAFPRDDRKGWNDSRGAASPVRHVEVTPELAARYGAMVAKPSRSWTAWREIGPPVVGEGAFAYERHTVKQ